MQRRRQAELSLRRVRRGTSQKLDAHAARVSLRLPMLAAALTAHAHPHVLLHLNPMEVRRVLATGFSLPDHLAHAIVRIVPVDAELFGFQVNVSPFASVIADA
jgi:hypothetical protein